MYLLGIDIGTTGTKALLVRPDGAVAAEATAEYPLSTPRPLWSEQDPEDWWRGTVAAVREVLRSIQPSMSSALAGGAPAATEIAAVGLTGQMHGLVLLDDSGDVLRPAILWNDQRCGAECDEIMRRVERERLLALTGNIVLPGFTAPKLVWVRRHEPGVYGRIAQVLLPKDYVRYRLTGAFCTDVADASGTSLFDVANRRWSAEMLAVLDVRAAWLPEVTESPVVSARISAEGAAATGLREGTPVVGGAGDQAAQAVGSGVIADGDASMTLGTSGVVFAACGAYRYERDGRLHAFCHAAPGRWHLMGVMLAAGGSLRWYRDTLCADLKARAVAEGCDVYDLVTEEAASVPAGAEGLVFLPYLSGERTPHADPHARGAFVGLTVRHTRAHLTRAVLEGVAFGMRDGLELIRAAGIAPREIRVSGGGSRNRLWRQILADVCECPLITSAHSQGAAYGAALLAGVGAGVFESVEDGCRRTAATGERCKPSDDTADYRRQYDLYRSLYPALKSAFHAASCNDY